MRIRRLSLHSCLAIVIFISVSGASYSNPPKPKQIKSIADCPPNGIGGDSKLNHAKNRTDAPTGTIKNKKFGQIAAMESSEPSTWSQGADRSSLEALGEGTAVRMEAFLIKVKHYTKPSETCNCKLPLEENNDFHLVLGNTPETTEDNSLTAEMTPRVRLHDHPEWTYAKLQQLAGSEIKIRVTGYLMLDTQHLHGGPHRLTNWEIHPVTEFEVKLAGTWKKLDDVTVADLDQ
jgi:hypothetical protein